MARWRGNFENSTKSLITQLTGFEDGEENFRLCLQFAMSNFKYHRFLDVDSHRVTRAVDGMCTKFSVHSQTEKAGALSQLIETFLTTPLDVEDAVGKTDTHYSVLYLLYLLSDNPTASAYTQPEPQEVPETVPEFDWAGYLLQGEDVARWSYAESPLLSEDDLSSESDSDHEREKLEHDEVEETDPTVATTTHDTSALITHATAEVSEKGFDWLKKNLVSQYWTGSGREVDSTGEHDCSNLSRDWASYQARTNPLYCETDRVFVTEAQVIREVLWMMAGVSDLFIFQQSGSRFTLRNDIYVSHLTNASLESVVLPFCRHGGHVQVLKSFVEEIVAQSCSGNEDESVPMTYQAFTQTVSQFLQDLSQQLTGVEKKMIKQEETITLSTLASELQVWMLKIDLVYSVYITGVAGAANLPTNSLKASHLLSVLYNTVLDQDSLGEFTPEMLSLLLPMWIQTSRPYLQMIGDWIDNGHLLDPMNEFVVQRNDSVKSTDEKFWENAFVLHMPKSSANSSVLSSTIAQFPEHEQVAVATAWAPKFLQPVVKAIVLTGKSMEVLENLGLLSHVTGNRDVTGKPKSLYDLFISSMEKTLGLKEMGKENDHSRKITQHAHILPAQIEMQMKVKGVYDPLLRINFESVFREVHVASSESTEKQQLRSLQNLKTEGLLPVEMLLQECLYPHVRERYEVVCHKLVCVLKEKYKLMDYFSVIRSFFLMEAGDTMFDFYVQIFDRMKNMEEWRDVSVLNLLLHEALYPHFPEESNRLLVRVDAPKAEKFPISVTDCIKLTYEVPWPVNLVISQRCQDIYNQIFSFLVQVKRSKFCLDQLRFSDLEKEDILKSFHVTQYQAEDRTRPERIHRMQILRFRLLYFVNSLHNHLMTRILHSTGLEFQHELSQSMDLDQIIASHNSYVGKIHERCLLHHKVSFLREAVLKVLNLILSFHRVWEQGVDEISMKLIEEMEVEFSRCIQFLASFLNNVFKRGSFPHLESLAFSLVTSMESKGR